MGKFVVDNGGQNFHKKKDGVWFNESAENLDLMMVACSHIPKSFVDEE